MPTQLIPTINGELAGEIQPLVNARDLHAFLNSRQEFANWIKNRIDEYRFIEGKDFSINLSKSVFGRPKHEYVLSLRMAEHLGMIERTERGQQVRDYFSEMEKIARQQSAIPLPRPGQVEAVRLDRCKEELLASRPLWAKVLRYKRMGLNTAEIGRLLEANRDTVRKHLRRMEACGLIEPPANLATMRLYAPNRRQLPGSAGEVS